MGLHHVRDDLDALCHPRRDDCAAARHAHDRPEAARSGVMRVKPPNPPSPFPPISGERGSRSSFSPSPRKSGGRGRGLGGLALSALTLFATPALAQPPPSSSSPPAEPPPPDPGSSISVPSGTGGVIIKPAEKPADAPKAGQPTMPRPLNYAPPTFPPEAEKAGLEATVTLQLDISKEGKVLQAVVIEPAGHGFDESAVAASKNLQFEPARRPDGTPFAARILYRYSFTQKKAEPPPQAG